MQWDQCRRFYNFLMADNMKKIILSHRYGPATLSRETGPFAACFQVTEKARSLVSPGKKTGVPRGCILLTAL